MGPRSGGPARHPVRPAFLVVLLALLVVPWSVQVSTHGPTTVLFAWGEVGLTPLRVSSLLTVLVHAGQPPGWVLGWPLAVCCHLLALGHVAAGVVFDRRDGVDARVTVGLLVLAGLGLASFALGFAAQPGRTAFPVGSAAFWLVAGWYWGVGGAGAPGRA